MGNPEGMETLILMDKFPWSTPFKYNFELMGAEPSLLITILFHSSDIKLLLLIIEVVFIES